MSHHCEPIAPILSIKDYNELINAEQPGLLDWKGFPTSFDGIKIVAVHLTFDEATCCTWKMAKEEIASILNNSRKPDLLNLSEAEKSTDRKYFHCFFSKEHRFINFQMFHLKVGLHYLFEMAT
jgi:hypothetical protein